MVIKLAMKLKMILFMGGGGYSARKFEGMALVGATVQPCAPC